jgi:8-oxo-dGTP pyrophosphatase MutT (NUDIX family)
MASTDRTEKTNRQEGRMPARLKVHAVIWVGERVVVDSAQRQGETHLRLPGGRVNERGSVTDALRREVLEEVGIEVDVGERVFVAEVVSGARIQDVELVFEARARTPGAAEGLDLVDPSDPAVTVLPPVLAELARRREASDGAGARWLGNLYSSRYTSV